jgi:DNA end-binding protein Ku
MEPNMSIRAQWKGHLKLSLVSCPVALYPAVSSDKGRVTFKMVNTDTMNRLKEQHIDSVTGDVVESEKKGKGFEIGKDQYLLVEKDELEAIQIESKRVIEIDRFVPASQIDPRYCEKPYYIAPDKVGQEAFAVIREAMKVKNMVGIGRVVLTSREHPIMIQPNGNGMSAMTLRYPSEVRNENAYFEGIVDAPVDADMLALASTIVDQKTTDFNPDTFVDRYEVAVVELIERKKQGLPPLPPKQSAPMKATNLCDLLRASINAENADKAPKAKKIAATKSQKVVTLRKKKSA